jgi:hypothetical protein
MRIDPRSQYARKPSRPIAVDYVNDDGEIYMTFDLVSAKFGPVTKLEVP